MLRHNYYERDEMRMQEHKWINLQEYYDIEFWAKKFSVTPEFLQLAVKESGSNNAEEVEKFIKSKYPF